MEEMLFCNILHPDASKPNVCVWGLPQWAGFMVVAHVLPSQIVLRWPFSCSPFVIPRTFQEIGRLLTWKVVFNSQVPGSRFFCPSSFLSSFRTAKEFTPLPQKGGIGEREEWGPQILSTHWASGITVKNNFSWTLVSNPVTSVNNYSSPKNCCHHRVKPYLGYRELFTGSPRRLHSSSAAWVLQRWNDAATSSIWLNAP